MFSFPTSESLIVSWVIVMFFGVEKKMAFDLEALINFSTKPLSLSALEMRCVEFQYHASIVM